MSDSLDASGGPQALLIMPPSLYPWLFGLRVIFLLSLKFSYHIILISFYTVKNWFAGQHLRWENWDTRKQPCLFSVCF